MPEWMQRMRKAALEQISENDVKEIIAAQVKRAKEGNPAATKFVFEQVLGGAAFKGANFVQNVTNHHYGTEHPEQPTQTPPGTKERVDTMAARVAQGLPIFDENDKNHEGLDLS